MAGSIPHGFIEDLLARIDIVDIIEPRLKLKKAGQNYQALCPFHNEKTPSFSVNQVKQFYYCFGCQASGDALKFLMEHDRMEFVQAVESLAATAGMEVPRESNESSQRQEKRKSLYEVLQNTCSYYKTQLREHEHRSLAVDYLKGRGVSGEIARDFAIGFAPPGWDNVYLKLAVTNADRQLLIDSGMLVEKEEEDKVYDRFRSRIMFPIRDRQGRVIAFGGRALGDDKPKYLNSPETQIFHKGRELYGLHEAMRQRGRFERILVVEGYMDVIALAQHGVKNTVATLGTATSRDHLERLFRLVPEIVFCFDGDDAGQNAAWKALQEALPLMKDGLSAKFLFLPRGEDPDSMIRQEGNGQFVSRIQSAQHLPEFFFQNLSGQVELDSMDGKAKLSKLAMPLIGEIPEGVFKQLMIDELAKLTGLAADRLVNVATPKDRGRSFQTRTSPTTAAPQRRRQSAQLSLADSAIALLLRQPDLVDECSDEEYAQLKALQDSNCTVLLELIHTIQLDSGIPAVRLLSQQQDSPHFDKLRGLAERDHLLQPDDLPAEYKGVIQKLLAQIKIQNFQQLKSQIDQTSMADLDPEERQKIKDAITASKDMKSE
jgi:DNA primase|tara:strand:+ start:4678 stop:6480 length:1803 start_codon:yes stop_codon:yes gene_type:complete